MKSSSIQRDTLLVTFQRRGGQRIAIEKNEEFKTHTGVCILVRVRAFVCACLIERACEREYTFDFTNRVL